jgi:hydroxymethylpyrimidine pyrophosphatase-like HAD family hydrolase
MIKLLALDLDGTLVGADYTISPRTRAALAAAQAQGVQVSLVTGRNWVSTRPYVRELALPAPHVVFNGAVVMVAQLNERVDRWNGRGDHQSERDDRVGDDNGDGSNVLYAQPLAWELVEALIALSRRHDLFLELHTLEHCYIERQGEESAVQRGKLNDPQTQIHFDALDRATPLLKAQFIFSQERQRRQLLAAEQELRGAGALSWGVSPAYQGWFVNVMSPGQDKDNGLEIALRHLGLGWDEVLAVGDSPADLCYISKAGLGFVMGNAPEEVRHQAQHVAPAVGEDGLAQVIEQHVLGARP